MGTTTDYFTYFSYGKKRQLSFSKGKPFEQVFDVVLGAQVAKKLNYTLGANIILAHGLGKTSFSMHDQSPLKVVGILAPTGTPVDQTVHVSLQGIEAVHIDWQQIANMSGGAVSQKQIQALELELEPKSITAFMLGLTSRMNTFRVQRDINNYSNEPLTAILPGVALAELWQMMGLLENTLRLISGLILVAALLGLSAMMLASIRERKYEIHLLRVIGAPPWFLFFLVELEALLVSFVSMLVGITGLYLSLLIAGDVLSADFGMHIGLNILSFNNVLFLLLVAGSTVIAAAIPSFMAYKSASIGR
jgi:putative ABC transport system permease protein